MLNLSCQARFEIPASLGWDGLRTSLPQLGVPISDSHLYAADFTSLDTGGKPAGRAQTPPADAAQPEQESRPPVPQYKIIDYGHADFGDATLRDDGMAMEGPYFDPQDG